VGKALSEVGGCLRIVATDMLGYAWQVGSGCHSTLKDGQSPGVDLIWYVMVILYCVIYICFHYFNL